MRINGFSGMDIDSMVKSMMTAQRVPLDKLTQQKQVLQWQRDSYRELNSKVFTLSNTIFKNYGLASGMNSYKSTVTGNTDAIKVVANANANPIPMTVTVKQLATQASIETTGAGYGLKSSATLAELQTKLDSAAPIRDTYALRINNVNFSFDKTLSISEVINKINADPDAKATAKFDELTGKLTILSKEFGSEAELKITDDAANNKNSTLFDLFKGVSQSIETGKQAKVKINDQDNLKFDSNIITVNGVQITLLATTTSMTDSTNPNYLSDDKPAKISTQTDSTKALETIKSFINDYNDLLGTLNSKISEERYKDFQPLTDEQKSNMTENDIKLWEEKAKSGMLKNDQIVKSTINNMRMEIANKLGQLGAIGITTGQYYENGKLYLDETKLKTALENDPQAIMDLFQGPASASNTGIMDKLRDVMDVTMTSFADKAGTTKYDGSLNSLYKEESSMGRMLKDYNKRILATQNRLTDMEARYYRQFTAMETAMNKYNAQSSSLLSSLGMSSNQS
ncbi:flagellar filament capping protein FliD [Paenibacillus nasutitermitis]|uniref:Flagellar hook-associated protein 2 n=1 Tax=Paenibacillus nasutitermitis TaxID=1652958 RepID=A0A917E205_9BACL|nr:flagellar filament capping protein FliD [Paenibacillus nasutitermitis]GGD92191.1 flagellar hook-associated protein 2 [Paenibacillus nasutitermitis]